MGLTMVARPVLAGVPILECVPHASLLMLPVLAQAEASVFPEVFPGLWLHIEAPSSSSPAHSGGGGASSPLLPPPGSSPCLLALVEKGPGPALQGCPCPCGWAGRVGIWPYLE